MIRRPPRSTRTDTLFPYTTLFRSDSITVILPNRKEYEAKLIGRDVASDLAVLKINASGLPFVKFGDSTTTRLRAWVIAIGNPFGLGSTVPAGILSALYPHTGRGRAHNRLINTCTPLKPGNICSK